MKAFLVCFQSDSKEIVYLLLEKLPKIWNEGIPTYRLGWLIDSVVVGDTEDEERFNWHITGSDRGTLEYFEYQHVEPGDCYLIEVDEDDKQMRFKNWIGRYYTDAVYQERIADNSESVQSVDHSDCEPAGVDSFDVKDDCKGITKIKITGVDSLLKSDSNVGTISHDSVDQSEEDQPALAHAYLVCHSVNGEKHFTLMWNLPIGWTTLDSIYYNKSDVIEEVVPGCKYSFTQTNMSAYSYGEAFMMPGDAISCNFVGNHIDSFAKLDRYSVQDSAYMNHVAKVARPIVSTPICKIVDGERYYTLRREVGKAEDEESRYEKAYTESIDDVNKDLDQLISENPNKDGVIRPNYYIIETPNGPIECKDVIGHMSYNCGAAVKYVWRAGRKVAEGMSLDDKEINDLEKAITHIAFEIERLGGKVDWSKFIRK